MLETYQPFAHMLSRSDNTVPNWQKVRAVHLNMKVSCFFSTNQGFFVSSESEPSKVGYKSHPNSLWWEQSSSGEHNNCFRRMDLSLGNDMYSLQAPSGCGQYFTASSGNISSLNWNDGTYQKWIPPHSLNTFHNLLIQGTPILPPVSNRTLEPVPFNTISKGKTTLFKTSKDNC